MARYTTTAQGTVVLVLSLAEARGLYRLAERGRDTLLTTEQELALLGTERTREQAYAATEQLRQGVVEAEQVRRRQRAA